MTIEATLVGSRYTCNPPPEDTDTDTLFFVDSNEILAFLNDLVAGGWEYDSPHRYKGKEFTSLRKEHENYLITDNRDFYNKFKTAAEVCKKLNLMVKADRIFVHQAIIYGNIHV